MEASAMTHMKLRSKGMSRPQDNSEGTFTKDSMTGLGSHRTAGDE